MIMKKKLISLVVCMGFICSFSANAVSFQMIDESSFPKEQTGAQFEVSGEDTFESGTYVGETYKLNSPQPYRAISFPNYGTILWQTSWNDSGATVIDRLVHQFVRYITNVWQKTSQYQPQFNTTISWTTGSTLEYQFHARACLELGLSQTASFSVGVGTTIPANPSKYSKLGLSSDFVGENFYREILHNGVRTSIQYDSFKAPVPGQQYLDVIYQG